MSFLRYFLTYIFFYFITDSFEAVELQELNKV